MLLFSVGELKVIYTVHCVLQDDAEHGGAVYDQDVLEDLFSTNLLKRAAQLQRQSDVYCYQSTQVSRADVPDNTVVIRPDFPVSPLPCVAPVSSDRGSVLTSPVIHSAGRLFAEAEMITVTAAHSRPVTGVVDCTEAGGQHAILSASSDAGLPSAVYNRVRDLFCTSYTEVLQNRLLSDTSLSSAASDGRQQSRSGDESVPDAGEIICPVAVSCSGNPSPLDSSYVDAGRMAYVGSDVNSLSTASVVSAADMPVVTACVENVENNVGELCITNVCSLQNVVYVATSSEAIQNVQSHCQETYVNSSLSPDNAKNLQLGGQSPVTKKKLMSPTDNSVHLNRLPGSKLKRSSLDTPPERGCDVLFRKIDKTKRACKKRRLHRDAMLLEDGMEEEQSQNIAANVIGEIYSHGGDGCVHRERKSESVVRNDVLFSCETVISNGEVVPSAAALVSVAVSLHSSQTSYNPAIASVDGISESHWNMVTAIGNKTGLNTQSVTTVPVDGRSHIPLEQQQTQGMEHDTAVTRRTDHTTDSEHDVAVVVTTSVLSPTVPNNGLCMVSGSVRSVSVLSPHFVECRQSSNNSCSSQILADDGRSANFVNDELLDSVELEHRTNAASADNAQLKVTNTHSPLCKTHRSRTADDVMKHTVSVETSSEILSSVTVESNGSLLSRHDDNTLVHDNDAIASRTRGITLESSEKPVCVTSVSNTSDPGRDSADKNIDVIYHSRYQSTSQKEIDCHGFNGTTDLKSVSSATAVDLAPCNTAVNGSGTTGNGEVAWNVHTTKQNLLRKKSRRLTTVTSRARRSSTEHNKNIVAGSRDVSLCHGLTSEVHFDEKTDSTTGLCLPSEITNEGSFQSLLCGQQQFGGSYYLPGISLSACRLSAVGTPFPPSLSCSLQCRERRRIAEESLGYRRPSMKASDDGSGGCCDQLMQSEKHSTSDLIASFKSNASSNDQSIGVAPPCTSADAGVVSGTETESIQSSSVLSGGTGRLTVPTPKNSLTCYQPANSSASATAVNDSSLVTATPQVQPNYALFQVFYVCTFCFIIALIERTSCFSS